MPKRRSHDLPPLPVRWEGLLKAESDSEQEAKTAGISSNCTFFSLPNVLSQKQTKN